MNCADIEKLILLQDSGEISEDQEQELITHLNNCEICCGNSSNLASLRKTFTSEARHLPEPSQKTFTIIRKAAKRHHNPKARPFSIPWPLALALATAASLTLCLTTLRFSIGPSLNLPAPIVQNSHAIEIIPLIAYITGTEPVQFTMEGDDAELTVLANELLRLQDMAIEWPGDKMDTPTLPEDYQPTTLLWNNIPGPQFGRCG
jgi:hypothetical protein